MIYLDYNASTPVDPAVREAMLPFLGDMYGNPTSNHAIGLRVRDAVEKARAQVAELIGASPREILFTSSGTESNNHVIKGVAHTLRERGKHIITSAVEHPAVINPCHFLEHYGYEISYVPVDKHGLIDPMSVAEEVRPTTILISIMHANNEVGTIQPIAEIAELAREGGIWMHTDIAQSCGKIAARVDELGVDFLSIAGHKLYAPQGVGALYIRKGISIEPLLHGAGHENGRRAGTSAVAAIVGLGAAAELAAGRNETDRLQTLSARLLNRLQRDLGDQAVLLGHPTLRLPNTVAIGFRDRIGAEILAKCPQLCASTGAACHHTARKRSATLAAMDVPESIAFGAIRFSLGHHTTAEEIDEATAKIVRAVRS